MIVRGRHVLAVPMLVSFLFATTLAHADETKRPPPEAPLTGSGDRPPPQRTVAKVNIAVGGTLVFVGILTGLAGLLKKHSIDEACPNKVCSANQAADLSTLRGYENVTNVFWVGGALILASGIGLYLYGEDPDTAAGKGTPPPSSSLRLAPAANGVVAIGSFLSRADW